MILRDIDHIGMGEALTDQEENRKKKKEKKMGIERGRLHVGEMEMGIGEFEH